MNMEEQEATIQPFVKNTVPEIIRRDSNAAWDSAVEKFNSPKPSPMYVVLYSLAAANSSIAALPIAC